MMKEKKQVWCGWSVGWNHDGSVAGNSGRDEVETLHLTFISSNNGISGHFIDIVKLFNKALGPYA